jgi:hypothetical protein
LGWKKKGALVGGFRKWIAILSVMLLCAPAMAQQEEAPNGWSLAEIKQAIDGAPLNGGTITAESGLTPQGAGYLVISIPNTDIPVVVSGVGCNKGFESPCQGVSIFYIGRHNIDGTSMNEFNGAFPYAKVYLRDEGYAVVSEVDLTIGTTDAEGIRFKFHVFAQDLFNFFNSLSKATASVDDRKTINAGDATTDGAVISLASGAPRYVVIGGEPAPIELIHALVDEGANRH